MTQPSSPRGMMATAQRAARPIAREDGPKGRVCGRWRTAAPISLALGALLPGCASEQVQPQPAGVQVIYGEAASTDLTPFPSDRYSVAADTATGLRVAIGPDNTHDMILGPGLEETVTELNALDGFSTHGGVIVSFSGPIDLTGIALGPEQDPATAAPLADASSYQQSDSPFILLDVDPSSPERGQARGLVPRWWEQPKDDYYLADEYTLIAQPAVPLRPRTRYLFVVTDALRARDGGPVRRSALSERLLSGELSGPYADSVAAGLAELESNLGLGAEHVVLATVFTAESVTEPLAAGAVRARAVGPPALREDWSVETPQAPDGRVRFRAVMDAPEYRLPLPDGRWQLDADGAPQVQQHVGLEVYLAFSDATSSAPRPVVIYGHGLAGDKDGCWGTAGRLAPIDAAVFAIDSPYHGSRATGGGSDLDPVFQFFGIDMSDNSFVIGRARDNFRQMALDQLELVLLIESLADLDILPPGAPDGIPDLDTSRILYIGHSFGSVQGATIFALAPEITHAVWNVGGAGLMTLLRDSGLFGLLVGSLKPEGTSDGAVARFMAVAQAIVDPGDPLNYARFANGEPFAAAPGWQPREVLLQEVIHDGIVPNSTSGALARAAGLQLVDALEPISGLPAVSAPVVANLPSGVTGAISQFDLMDGDKIATHGELIFSPEGMAQYLTFFQTALSQPHATVAPPY